MLQQPQSLAARRRRADSPRAKLARRHDTEGRRVFFIANQDRRPRVSLQKKKQQTRRRALVATQHRYTTWLHSLVRASRTQALTLAADACEFVSLRCPLLEPCLPLARELK